MVPPIGGLTLDLFDDIFSQTEEEIKNETDKRARWAKDNIRRRHNFLPLVMEIIKQMASQKSLVPAVTKVRYCYIYNIFHGILG